MRRTSLILAALFLSFPVSAQSVVPGRAYALIAQHSGLCLDVKDGAEANGTAVVQSRCDAEQESQLFYFSRSDDGYLTLRPVHSGHCIGVGAGSTEVAATVTQYECHGGENQQLRVRDNADGTYTLTARHTGHCLGIGAASKEPGAEATQWECHGNANQRWYAYPLGRRAPVRQSPR